MKTLLEALEISNKMTKEEFDRVENDKRIDSKKYNLKYEDDFFEVYLNRETYDVRKINFHYVSNEKNEFSIELPLAM